MTNDLDNLLEQVEDVLEEDGSALWQPDLTSLCLLYTSDAADE